MQVNREETARYLGLGGHAPEGATAALIEECAGELETVAVPRHVSRRIPVEAANHKVVLAGECIQSRDLAAQLKDCREVVLLAATLGAAVDRLFHKYGRTDVARAAVLNAAANALLEDWSAACEAELAREMAAEGRYLLPRLAPGYGDFPLDCQAALLDALNAGRRIGLTLTAGGMLIPSKSCTAVLGVSDYPAACPSHKCQRCGDASCPYRKSVKTK